MVHWILHVDMDAFFAAIEQRDRPELRGTPVVVGGDPASRGVVAAASYEARRFGIHSAMPAAEARRRCPQAVFLPGRGARYREVSAQVMEILRAFTPLVEQVSVDEAFLDVTGCERLFGPAEEIARRIQERIVEELGLTASIGVAPNKFLAKLGSEYRKPAGLTVIRPEAVGEFLRELPLTALWGVGQATAERLSRLGLRTVGQLADYPVELLERQLGEHGRRLHELAHGQDDSPVAPGGERKSMSAETTFAHDTTDRETLERALLGLSEQVGRRLRQAGLAGQTVTLKVRFSDFRTLTRRVTRPEPINEDLALYQRARGLLQPYLRGHKPLRLVGVAVSGLTRGRPLTLFASPSATEAVDRALDRVRDKFGTQALQRGRLVTKDYPEVSEEDDES